jgi:hypothetical protein
MNRDAQFEQLLRRQPPREIPAAWREEILAAAAIHGRALPAGEPDFAARWRLRLRELLWPCPQAWAGLASIWLAILALHFVTPDTRPAVTVHHTAPSSPTWLMLRQQQQMLAELGGALESGESRRSNPVAPQPRSQRREEFGLA